MTPTLDGCRTLARPLLGSDLVAVLAIEQRAYGHPWSLGNFADSLAAGYWAEGLWLDAEPIAYVIAQPGAGELHLLNLTVDPAHQRRGHARALLNHLIVQATGRGFERVMLEVRQGNARAQALYRAAGFGVDGVRRHYYPAAGGRREDAVLMSIRLAPPDGEGSDGAR